MGIRSKTLTLFIVAISFGLLSCSSRFRSLHTSPSSFRQETAIRMAAESWLGVPYRLGGNSKKGIDCSGLAVQLYREVFHTSLPRSAKEQRTLGYAVHAPYLKPGDLLFFRFKREEGIEHVGVYLGDGQFVHASQTRGVVIDRLDTPYYRKHLVVARRVLH